MSEFDWTKVDFEEIIEYVAEQVGGDFKKAVSLANDMLENPSSYTGFEASMAARRLAAYRVKLGIEGSYLKLKTPQTKRPLDRLTKDAVLVMYDSLLELINCLKAQAKYEKETVHQ